MTEDTTDTNNNDSNNSTEIERAFFSEAFHNPRYFRNILRTAESISDSKIVVKLTPSLFCLIGLIMPTYANEVLPNYLQKTETTMTLPTAQPHDATHSFDALIQMIKTPTNVTELLHNIKFAVDHELPMNRDFYQEAILKRFSGGGVIKISSYNAKGITFSASEPNDIFDGKSDIGSFLTSEINYSYDKPSKKYAYLNVYLPPKYTHKFTYDMLTSVFGTDAVFTDPPEVPMPRPPQFKQAEGSNVLVETIIYDMPGYFDRGEVTHPHGNKDFLISWRHNNVLTQVTGEIMGNGEVHRFKIKQKEE